MIEKIELENFRNHKNRVFEFKNGVNLIVGPNASGKTNLLEAIYFCLCGKSFKSRDLQLITFGENFFKIEADIVEEGLKSHVICYVDNIGIKRIMINDKKVSRLSELFERFKFVFFRPDDTELIKSEPSLRRRFLDMIILKVYPYMNIIFQDYLKALHSRNAFLKSYNKKDVIDVYDMELSKLAYAIVSKRKEVIEMILPVCNDIWRTFTKDNSTIDVLFKPSLELMDEHDFYKKLKENLQKDVSAGWTTKGPHRDDFEVYINNKNAKEFASEGQIKIACLSIILSTVKLLKNPILILDDIFSELDLAKRNNILDFCKGYQTIITCADDLASLGLDKDKIINLIYM